MDIITSFSHCCVETENPRDFQMDKVIFSLIVLLSGSYQEGAGQDKAAPVVQVQYCGIGLGLVLLALFIGVACK